MLACRNSGNVEDHFPDVRKTVEMPSKPQKIGFVELNKTKNTEIGFLDVRKTKTKSIIDYKLSRYACYVIVQNGDPRKEIIATGVPANLQLATPNAGSPVLIRFVFSH